MPYIVTTNRPWDWRCECGGLNRAHEAFCYRCGAGRPEDHERTKSSCRAVATLEEARKIAADLGRAHLAKDDPAVAPWLAAGILRLPESGGTVGPLPDGTVIEVEPIAFSRLYDMVFTVGEDPPATPAEVIDAFNAREVS